MHLDSNLDITALLYKMLRIKNFKDAFFYFTWYINVCKINVSFHFRDSDVM